MTAVHGTSKATQEADNVLILQNYPNYKVIEVKKNRFDGDLGGVGLKFDKPSNRASFLFLLLFFFLKKNFIFLSHLPFSSLLNSAKKREKNWIVDMLQDK